MDGPGALTSELCIVLHLVHSDLFAIWLNLEFIDFALAEINDARICPDEYTVIIGYAWHLYPTAVVLIQISTGFSVADLGLPLKLVELPLQVLRVYVLGLNIADLTANAS